MKDVKKKTGKSLERKLQLYPGGLSSELAEQLRTLFHIDTPSMGPDEEERALQALAKELVALKKMKKAY